MPFKILLTRKDGTQTWLAETVDAPTPNLGAELHLEVDGRRITARVEMIGKGWDPPEPGFVEKVSATEVR
jgi:hypothetical protein